MTLDRNLVAGITNSVWSAALGLVVVPLYIKFLGIEAYGLIAFFTTIQAMLLLFDMGLAPTMNRVVAQCSATQNLEPARVLLRSLSVVYWATAVLIAIAIGLLAPLIADHWLRTKSLSRQSAVDAVFLMGVVLACRWPIGLYQGAIMGAQKLLVSSSVNIVMITVSNVGAIVVLAVVAPRIEVFFMWQALVGIAYALAMRTAAWRILGGVKGAKFDLNALRKVWRFSVGMSGVAITGSILSQLDKVVLSRMLSLEAFGAYALAVTLSGALFVFVTPVFNVLYPKLSAMVASNDTANLTAIYRVGTRLFLSLLFPVATFVSVYSYEIILLWTGNVAVAAHAAPIASIFIIGAAINGAMYFPYALQLAYGVTRLPLTINGILLILTVPSTVFLASHFGALGGASSWALVNTLYLFIGTWLTHRRLVPGIAMRWLAFDVGVPATISIVIVGGLSLLAVAHTSNIVLSVGIGIFTGSCASILIALTSSLIRTTVWRFIRARIAALDA
jgi:O-antigen/teichoic acid export membrane protein